MILVNTVRNHSEHKPVLLNLIDNFKKNNNTRYENINSDWNFPNNINRKYRDYFYDNVIEETMLNIGDSLGFNTKFNWNISNSWFQQYKENEKHDWHNHPDTHFSNCYFLELPDDTYKTQILDSNGNIVEYKAKEGDVLTMSAWMKHRSPSNGKERKTVIAFNSSYSILL